MYSDASTHVYSLTFAYIPTYTHECLHYAMWDNIQSTIDYPVCHSISKCLLYIM